MTDEAHLADRLAIEDLLYRYCHLVDRGTADELAALFVADAILHPPYPAGALCTGREAVRDWFAEFIATVRAQRRDPRHRVTTPMIALDGARARSTSYFDSDALAEDPAGASIVRVAQGRYDDVLVRSGGEWRFAERRIVLHRTLRVPADPDVGPR